MGRSLEKIVVGDILRATENSFETVDAEACDSSNSIWHEISVMINDCIDSVTLKDLVEIHEAMDRVEYNI